MTRLIGLTGGIACGKSAVTDMLQELGAVVVDADELARTVVAPGSEGLSRIVERFGQSILDSEGHLDRAALAAVVFADQTARADLEAITHPLIAQLSRQQIDQASKAQTPLVVYSAPLLFENKLESWLGEVIVVDVDQKTQRQRLLSRDGKSGLERIKAQMPLEEKRARASYLIDNSGSREQTVKRVRELYQKLVEP